MKDPRTLQEAIVLFANPDNALAYMVEHRWPNGVECPACGSKDVRFISTRRIWECKNKHPKRQFTVKVGTIFEDSPLGLQKWLPAVWMLTNCKNGVSSYEIHRALGVTQKTAWFMMHRIRLALSKGSLLKLGGSGREVEVDETFIGGKARSMHSSVHKRRIRTRGVADKTVVFGILERGKEVRTLVIKDRQAETVVPIIKEHVEICTDVFTDDMSGYRGLAAEEFFHGVVDHATEYVYGRVHTNGMENFWSLLKRSLGGTYVSVEPFHLFRYLDEQSFRYNNRGTRRNPINDGQRFDKAMSSIVGKRVTYEQLTGKLGDTQVF